MDVAFLDPPFPAVREWDFAQYTQTLFDPLADVLAEDGIIVLRTPADVSAPETLGKLVQKRSKTYGDMTIAFYQLATLNAEE